MQSLLSWYFSDISTVSFLNVEAEITLTLHSSGVCEIQLSDELTLDLTQGIVEQVQTYNREHAPCSGLLLDVSRVAPLSMVRLSGLIDVLTQLRVPIAVVFLWNQQRELAQLLHHTLTYPEHVRYFTQQEDAWLYLEPSGGGEIV
ncbi:MAG: hypothetical protein GXY36_06575 [Chloroflexi bacterium]|nr:hypothetical protein [Chloroflexota bacterium]